MPYSISYTASGESVHFIDIVDALTDKEIDEIIGLGEFDRIQCTKLPPEEALKQLNDRYYSKFLKTGFRLYGVYFEPRDLTPLKIISRLERLSLDCMHTVENQEAICSLKSLKSLRVEVEKLTDFEFVKGLPTDLEQFSLHTSSKAFDISILTRYENLKGLFLGGYKKNIESLSSLKHLGTLTLSGITLGDMSFLNQCPSLKHLKIMRGNTTDFTGVYGNKTMKILHLFRINNFTDIDLLCHLPSLEAVELVQLKHITHMPNLADHASLKHISIDDLKSLTDLSSLAFVKTLESVSAFSCPTTFEPTTILPVLKNPAVKQCSFYTSSKQKNEMIDEYIQQYKKQNANNTMLVNHLKNTIR